ncbi:phage tail protein [Sphingomicrobium sp. XHP0239]|uniref:phage tail protein n=1 Tax=Sphingomicrobium maritimum TaxID=3133972 RepID=UPI0031CCD330
MSFNPAIFIAQLGASYLLSRFSAQSGPGIDELAVEIGDYGAPKPRVYGAAVRLSLPVLAWDGLLDETEHVVEDYSEVAGAISGAAAGFQIGGPIGAVVGGVLGGLLGSAAPEQKYWTYSATCGWLLADRIDDKPIEGLGLLWGQGRLIFDSGETPAISETLDADGNLLKRVYGANRYFKSLTIYGGGDEQTADPVLEGRLGDQPGYRHRAYVVVEDLQLENFGNSVPGLEGLVEANANVTLADFAEAICARAGIDPVRNLSTTALIDMPLRGYAITGETSCWDALSPLFPVYRFEAAERGGQIQFFERAQAMRATIPTNAMGAHEAGTSPNAPYRFTRAQDIELPQETSVTFMDPARDYQPNTASAQAAHGDAQSNVSVNLNLVMSAEEGATAAATLHWDAWLGRTTLTTTLTGAWAGIAPGVAYGVQTKDASVLPFIVRRVTRGANGLIEVEAQSDEAIAFTGRASGANAPIEHESTLFADTVVVPIDMPMTSDGHDDFGFYVAMGAGQRYWNRGRIEVSNGGTFATLLDQPDAAVMGAVVGTLGPDDETLTVELLHDGMTLEDASTAELDAYANFLFVGMGRGEYIQFASTTKIAPKTWELSGLRRGVRGSEDFIDQHSPGEMAVVMGEGGIYRIPVTDDSGWGDALSLRGVTLYQDPAGVPVVPFTNVGIAKRPFAPTDLVGSFDAGDLDLAWTDRSRFFGADGDAPAVFDVEIVRGGVVVRTLAGLSSQAATYTAAQRTSDGFASGEPIGVRVYRVNDDFGRSAPLADEYLEALTAHNSFITADSTMWTADGE